MGLFTELRRAREGGEEVVGGVCEDNVKSQELKAERDYIRRKSCPPHRGVSETENGRGKLRYLLQGNRVAARHQPRGENLYHLWTLNTKPDTFKSQRSSPVFYLLVVGKTKNSSNQ